MKAIVLNEVGQCPQYQEDYQDPIAQAGEVVVDLHYAGLNRRDYYITQGLYPRIKVPVVLGSDGMGMVGDRKVIIYPAEDWGDHKRYQSDKFTPLGMPKDGTLAEQVAVREAYLFDVPPHLEDAEVGCLGLAGLTAYRAVFSRADLKKNERVLITGIGGGVAMLACQMAVAAGAHVWVTSSSEDKIAKAVKLGANGGYLYTEDGWHKKAVKVTGGFDVIVDGAGGEGFDALIKASAPGGRIAVYGGTRGPAPSFNTQIAFWRQLSILGSTMGSPKEFGRMLRFVSKYQIRPVLDRLYYWGDVEQAFDAMRDSTQFGKIAFSLR